MPFSLPSSLTPSNLLPDQGLLWALEVDLNSSLGLPAPWGQLWRGPTFEDPRMAWFMPLSRLPSSVFCSEKARPHPTMVTSNSSSRACAAHCTEAEPHVPLPVTTEGRPPMPAGNHPSVPRERDQNRSLLGPAHKWGPAGRLLRWKWVGRPPGLTLGPWLG